MKFLNFLPSTRLNRLQLLDIAMIIALIPHLFLLKLPMLLYILFALIFIYKQKKSPLVINSFTILGLLSIALSFLTQYNFSSVSNLLVFVSILVSILCFAVVLQRLTQEVCIYLILSPAMLMGLSFFFYNSIEMLFYALFALFCFSFLILYDKMQSTITASLRINILLYLFSLPIVGLLFLVFPRISYKDASFGFRGSESKRTGHDGTMYLDSNALLIPSKKLVMEVAFKKEVPPQNQLYFRGSTLYVDKKVQWTALDNQKSIKNYDHRGKDIVSYNVKLYPHQKRWLYMLDLPISIPANSSINKDYITLSDKPLEQSYQYNARSALLYQSDKQSHKDLEIALVVDTKRDSRVYEKLLKAIDLNEKDTIKAQKLLAFFSKLGLAYSLQPKAIDLERPVDSFLLDSKVGYCVHFAASFASSARMLGIPSRIVTGYKADRSNAINNYLLVRESDAHAWVELYLKERGWVRFEPTATASKVIPSLERGLSNSYLNTSMKTSGFSHLIKQINMRYLYTRYLINTWVLQYDRKKQIFLLKKLVSDSLFLFKFIASFLAFALLSFSLFLIFQKRQCKDDYLCALQKILKILKKEGFIRLQGETMFDFFRRVIKVEKRFKGLEEISQLYHAGKYAKYNKKSLSLFKAKVDSFISNL